MQTGHGGFTFMHGYTLVSAPPLRTAASAHVCPGFSLQLLPSRRA